MKISVYTVTLGRELYLTRLIESIEKLGGRTPDEHIIAFQGVKPSGELRNLLNSKPYIKTIEWDTNCGIDAAVNKIVPILQGDLLIKMDEDCIIRSPDFFIHTEEIARVNPNLIFSPYPVGLIGNPGGVLSNSRDVKYGEKTDTYYTFRYVHHIGGFARISPKNCNWQLNINPNIVGHSEDGVYSTLANQLGVRMAYLENALIVEHQESTLGQHQRYGETYFKGRF